MSNLYINFEQHYIENESFYMLLALLKDFRRLVIRRENSFSNRVPQHKREYIKRYNKRYQQSRIKKIKADPVLWEQQKQTWREYEEKRKGNREIAKQNKYNYATFGNKIKKEVAI